jgi:bacteriorhodopsin
MVVPSFENFFSYSPMAYDVVSHALTLGYAVMLAALFYFVLTLRTVAPRYRISSILSVVVMVSAFLILLAQQQSWVQAFDFNPESGLYEPAGAENFSNGFRYLNWLIDVPMLLLQILFVVEITRAQRNSLRNQFFFSGAMMIITGYIGQFYEMADDRTLFFVMGAISTLFFFHVLYLMYRLLSQARKDPAMPAQAGMVLGGIWWLFLISWTLYPVAYLMPVLIESETGVVARQLLFTVADISSKVVYGILLAWVAQIRSEADGYVWESLDATGDRIGA